MVAIRSPRPGASADAADVGSAGSLRSRAPRAALILALLLGLLIWLSSVELASETAGAELDPSWQQVMGHALHSDLRFGRDLAFTFGPLGYFARGVFDPELWNAHVYLDQVLFKGALALVFVLLLFKVPTRGLGLAFLACVWIAVPSFDALYFLAIVGLVTHLLLARAPSVWLDSLCALGLVILGYVKFTSTVLAIFGLALVVLTRAAQGRAGRRAAAQVLGIAVVLEMLVWLALGQSIGDYPRWFALSLEIAAGHSEAMALSGDGVALAIGIALVGATTLLAGLLVAERPRDRTTIACALLHAGAAFVAFKAGFTRQGDNAVTTYSYFLAAPVLLLASCSGPSRAAITTLGWRARLGARPARLLLCGILALAWSGLPRLEAFEAPWSAILRPAAAVRHGVLELANVSDRKASLERKVTWKRSVHDLPAVRARVGDESIDVFGVGQGVALLNGLRYTPRPLFQSYVAYTERLAQRNAEFYRSTRAPRFVLFRLDTIDERMPGMEDGAALLQILQSYELVLAEKDWLLFERRAASAATTTVPLHEIARGTARNGEWISIPAVHASPLVLALDLRPTLLGKIARILVRAPIHWVELEFEDGRREQKRVVPALLRSGVPVDPYFNGTDDVLRWCCGVTGSRIERLRIVRDDDSLFVEPRANWILETASFPHHPRDDARLASLLYPWLQRLPARVQAAHGTGRVVLRGYPAVTVTSPTTITWDLGESDARAVVRVAPRPLDAGWQASRPCRFRLLHCGPAGRVELTRVELDPARTAPDRGLHELIGTFAPAPGTTLELVFEAADLAAGLDAQGLVLQISISAK